MMEKKYKLTDETISYRGKTLYRIEALRDFNDVKKGDKGGFVESEKNLSHDGNCWIYNDAKVFGNARVYQHGCVFDEAMVSGHAEVYGHAAVYDDAIVCKYAKVFEEARISDNAAVVGSAYVYGTASIYDMASVIGCAQVSGDAMVCDNACVGYDARVYDNAIIEKSACISGCARVHEKAMVSDNITVSGNSDIHGKVRVKGSAYIYNAEISQMDDYIVFKNWWSSGRYFTWTRRNNMWKVGCFYGTGDELIAKAYKDSELSGREYERVVRYVEAINQSVKPVKRLNRFQRIVCKLFRIK